MTLYFQWDLKIKDSDNFTPLNSVFVLYHGIISNVLLWYRLWRNRHEHQKCHWYNLSIEKGKTRKSKSQRFSQKFPFRLRKTSTTQGSIIEEKTPPTYLITWNHKASPNSLNETRILVFPAIFYHGIETWFGTTKQGLSFKAETLVWCVPQHMVMVIWQHWKFVREYSGFWDKYTDYTLDKKFQENMNDNPKTVLKYFERTVCTITGNVKCDELICYQKFKENGELHFSPEYGYFGHTKYENYAEDDDEAEMDNG